MQQNEAFQPETVAQPLTVFVRHNFTPRFLARLRTARLEREIDERLAARKAARSTRSEAAKLGWQTRRSS
jgi:hypothetical protein